MSIGVRGFTLVELMITVAIVGILASVAYPGYQSQIRKSHRADAQAELMKLQNFMERFFTEHNCYQLNCLAVPANPTLPSIRTEVSNFYTISFDTISTTAYRLQAVPKADTVQESDSCGTLKLSNLGEKTAATSACW